VFAALAVPTESCLQALLQRRLRWEWRALHALQRQVWRSRGACNGGDDALDACVGSGSIHAPRAYLTRWSGAEKMFVDYCLSGTNGHKVPLRSRGLLANDKWTSVTVAGRPLRQFQYRARRAHGVRALASLPLRSAFAAV